MVLVRHTGADDAAAVPCAEPDVHLAANKVADDGRTDENGRADGRACDTVADRYANGANGATHGIPVARADDSSADIGSYASPDGYTHPRSSAAHHTAAQHTAASGPQAALLRTAVLACPHTCTDGGI